MIAERPRVPGAAARARSDDASHALKLKQLEEQIRQIRGSVVCGLNQLLDLKDINTGCHCTRLAEWAVRVGEELGLDAGYQHNIEVACLLHDVGKIGVPDAILRKAGPLTAQERVVMNRHPEYGWAILRLFPGLERAGLFALHHHERFEGGGYPAGLRGEGIPLGARIVTVVDAFDAMVSDRCYRKGLGLSEAIRRLQAGSGTQFDPDIVRSFVHLAQEHLSDVSRIVEPQDSAPQAPAEARSSFLVEVGTRGASRPGLRAS